jgi:HK97 family phage major capsid protein
VTAEELKQFLNNQDAEIKHVLSTKHQALEARLMALEQRAVARGGGPASDYAENIGELLVSSDGFKAVQKGARSSGQIPVRTFQAKATVLSGTWSSAPQHLPIIAQPGERRLTVRDLIPQLNTVANMVEFASEDSITGGADYQVGEGTAKAETSFTYSLKNANVVTLAHYLGASRQLLDDSQAFSQYVNNRLMYLLQLKEESELLFGNGTTGHLKGICPQATSFSSGTTDVIDSIGLAISQLASADREADAVVMNVSDWWNARLKKASTAGVYMMGTPLTELAPTLFGLRTVATPSMSAGHFLVGQFAVGAALFDRMSATIEVSREHSDWFIKNLVAILCEERLALVCYRGDAFIYGVIGSGS